MDSPSADVAYYYPAPYWFADDGAWIKSLLLFFDRVAILLPGYMYGRQHAADPTLAEPLEALGLLEVLEPNTWVDQTLAEELTTVLVDMLVAGAFDDLPAAPYFAELSMSRMGHGADVELSKMLVEELATRGLARPTEDGVSIPLHPVVRITILVLLGQLARSAGSRRGMSVHPATNDFHAAQELLAALSRAPMPSAGHVVALDLETVTLDLDPIPLDEVLGFRSSHAEEHKAYMRSLRGFLAELAGAVGEERHRLVVARQQELADAASDLRSAARRGFGKNLAGWSLGLAGAAWAVTANDPLGFALSASGLVAAAVPKPQPAASAYSYVFGASDQFAR